MCNVLWDVKPVVGHNAWMPSCAARRICTEDMRKLERQSATHREPKPKIDATTCWEIPIAK